MSCSVRVLFFTLCAGCVWAQTASVTGRITDSSGAVIPGAKITLVATGTGARATIESNAEGYYTVPSLAPGTYNLAVEKQGFRPVVQSGLQLIVQQVARLDVKLEVGAVVETVEVSAKAMLLDSESSTLGQVIQSRQIVELPLLGRNPYALAMLVAGVRPAAGVNDVVVNQITTSSYSINGLRGNANEFLLDGAPNSAPSQNQPVIHASVDLVQEFKVETNAFSAEYGRAAGGVFNVVTKSGTNSLHGAAYEFLRNTSLNANNWFANRGGQPRPPFRFNQFGGAFGGPVYIPKLYDGRNRTFFFVGAELVRFVEGVTFTGTMPSAAQRDGDFSATLNANGAPIQIYDPATTRRNPAGTAFVRDLFPGNRIPANRFDPVARAMMAYVPAPNAGSRAGEAVNNFSRTDGNRTDKDTFSARLDHHFSDRNRLFGRYSYDNAPIDRAVPYGKENIASPGTGFQIFERRNGVVEDLHTFRPNLTGTFRYSFTRLGNRRRPFSDGFDLTRLGFSPAMAAAASDLRVFPRITVTGFGIANSLLGATDIIRLGNDVHAWQGNFNYGLSRHTVKSGFEYRVIRFNNLQTAVDALGFSYAPDWTQGPNPAQSTATAGFPLASFLLGLGNGSYTSIPAVAQQSIYHALFVQDDWKITPNLTLNLGLRYDYESPRQDRYNQLSNFDYDAVVPLRAPGLQLRGALSFPGTGGLSRLQAEPDRNNFAPRVGFAYKMGAKTVVRSGGGLFFASNTGIGTGSAVFGVSGFEASTSMVTSLDGVTPLNYLRDPFPTGINRVTGSSLGPATLLGQNIAFFDRGNRIPYSQQWNLNIQRELGWGMLFDVGYAGSHGLKFPQTRTMNQLPDSALALGSELRTLVPNPFAAQITTGPLAQSTVSRAQLLRPYPHFGNVSSNLATWANSVYHALQAKFEKRTSHGLTFLASYTFSKLMDYATGTWNGEELGGGGIQNWNNLRDERSIAELDQKHRFIVNAVYELPFAKNARGFRGAVAAGWEIGAIYSAFSGGPLGTGAATNNTFSQGGGQRPNWTGVNPRLDNPTPDRWFDTAQFSNPPAYTFGNAARTLSGNRTDGTAQIDMTLSKTTRLAEKLSSQFRAECFNLTNTPRFGPANIALGNRAFGSVSTQGNLSRIVQFALKLNF